MAIYLYFYLFLHKITTKITKNRNQMEPSDDDTVEQALFAQQLSRQVHRQCRRPSNLWCGT
jgi:hypothetical protein